MLNLACNIGWMGLEVPLLERPRLAKDLGFDVVECPLPYEVLAEQLAEACSSSEIRFLMFNGAPGDMSIGEYGLACLPGREGEFQDAMGTAFEYAKTLNTTFIHLLAGIVPEGLDREKAFEKYLENVAWTADEADKLGVTVLLEPINTFEKPGYLLNLTAEAVMAIDALDQDNIGIQYDFHNAQMMEGYITHNLSGAIDYVKHMQIAGLPGRTPPDEGEIDYGYCFKLIERLGYDGFVGLEYWPHNKTEPGSAKKSVAWIKTMLT